MKNWTRFIRRLFTRKPKAVGMGSPTTVLGRVKSIARANISELLEEADEPEKMANGLITRYEAALDEARTAVQQAITSLRATQGKQAEDEEQIPVWRDKAEMAAARARSLQSKDADGSAEAEELALRALKEERRLTIRVDNRRASIEDQEEIVDGLKKGIEQMGDRLSELEDRRDVLVSRSRFAAAKSTVASATKAIDGDDPTSGLHALERSVKVREAMAQGEMEIANSSVEAQFRELEALTSDSGTVSELDRLMGRSAIEGSKR